MKTKLIVILALINIAAIAKAGDWWTDWSVSPYAAIRTQNITEASDLGAGLDVGYNLNNSVSLHVQNSAYELNDWRGTAIDETSLLGRADFSRSSKERLVVYGLAGVDRSWDRKDWGLGVGLGGELRFGKNVNAGISYRVRFWDEAEKDGLAALSIGARF